MEIQKAVGDYLDDLKLHARPVTLNLDAIPRLRAFCRYLEKNRVSNVESLSEDAARGYFVGLKNRRLSDWSIRSHYRRIRAFVTWCLKKRLLEKDPLQFSLRSPAQTMGTDVPIRELDAMLEKSKEIGFYWPLLPILRYTGIRIGEAMNLTWDDVNFKHNQIKIVSRNGFIPKGNRERAIPFPDKLKAILLLVYAKPETRKEPGTPIIATEIGRRLAVAPRLNKLKKACGLNLSYHDFRHGYACQALKSKSITLFQLSRLLGHASITITEGCYGHFATGNLGAEVESIFG